MSLETTNQGLQKALSALRKQNQKLKQQLEIWRTTAMATDLVAYLENLNSAETQWGIWVNPEDPNQYRQGQFCFENGGILDNWVCIGSLDKLSFGFQSQVDAIEQFLEESNTGNSLLGLGQSQIDYGGRTITVNVKAIIEAYSDGKLDDDFRKFLEEKAEEIEKIWSQEEAWDFVHNKLPEILEAAKQPIN